MAVRTHRSRPGRERLARPRLGLVARMRRSWTDYLYVAPALSVMLFVIGYPIYYTVYLSFFDTPRRRPLAEKAFIGLENYVEIVTSSNFWEVTQNTLVWTVFSTVFAFLIGLGAALVVQREFLGRGLVRGLLLIPYVISYVVAAYVWRWLYHSDFGLISGVLMDMGLIDRQINFLDSVDWAMPSLIVANIWKEFPFAMIMLLAGLQTVPEQLHRAAQIDGASSWNRFWHVTAPYIRGVIIITMLLLLLINLNSFTLVYIMTAGGPAGATEIWITDVYQLAFGRNNFGEAGAYSVILFLAMMSMGYFYIKAMTRGDERRGER